MSQEKIKTEARAIKIVDGFITVELIRRKKQPWYKGNVSNFLRMLKEKRKHNDRMEQRAAGD